MQSVTEDVSATVSARECCCSQWLNMLLGLVAEGIAVVISG